jgi:hypothetical protein
MTGLGQTSDPQALIPGEPAYVYQAEVQLRQYGDVLLEAGNGLRRVDTSDGWQGAAADAFREVYDNQPGRWLRAGDAFHNASGALDGYASTLSWAQDTAAVAIGQWNAGDRQAAAGTLAAATSQLTAAGDTAAAAIGRARDLAPSGPGIWDELASDAGSYLSDAGHFLETAGQDTAGALASLGNAALSDPGSLAELAAGLALTDLSAGGEALGVVLDATGIGIAPGLALNAVSAGGIAAGLGLAGTGLSTITRDAHGPDRITMMNAQEDAPRSTEISNRVRPPQDGDVEYKVYDPNDPGHTITDIDQVADGTFWEEKSATGQNPRMDTRVWIQDRLITKLNSYVEAREYLPGWEHAPFGVDFTKPGATVEFRAAVEQAVDQWKAENPGIDVTVRWAK